MKSGGIIHSLAASSRIANVPSVLCNVLLGVALAALWGKPLNPTEIAPLMLAGVFLYFGGNFLNDWADRDWDAKHRPERALPRGLFPSGVYLIFATAFMAAGLGFCAMVHTNCLWVGAAIAVMILLYTRIHKRSAWSVIPMGICRGLLPVLALATSPHVPLIVALAPCALFLDIALLTWRARFEGNPDHTPMSGALSRLVAQLPALQLLTLATQMPNGTFAYLGILPLVFRDHVCRTSQHRGAHTLISALLVSLPLLDWVFLFPAAWQAASTNAPLAVACLCFPPVAFFAGQLLQRWVTPT